MGELEDNRRIGRGYSEAELVGRGANGRGPSISRRGSQSIEHITYCVNRIH